MTFVQAKLLKPTCKHGHRRVRMVMCCVGKLGPGGWVNTGGFN